MNHDLQYQALLKDVLQNGVKKIDRTGTGTLSVFSRTMRFDISHGKIPLLTTKKVFTKGLIHELLWFLSGDTNVRYLKEHNVNIWDSWVKKGTGEYSVMSLDEVRKTLLDHFKDTGAKSVSQTYVAQLADEEWRHAVLEENGELAIRFILNEKYAKLLSKDYLEDYEGLEKELLLIVCKDLNLPTLKLVAGELGPVYGKQWRAWEDVRIVDDNGDRDAVELRMRGDGYSYVGELVKQSIWKREIDQIAEIVRQLKEDPDSRRIILNAWNVAHLDEMGLPPCHLLLQFYTTPYSEYELKKQLSENDIGFSPMEMVGVEPNTVSGYEFWKSKTEKFGLPTRHLSAELRCRSQDLPLGTPFNIAQYAVLIHAIAQVANMSTKEFIWSGGDCHIYLNQIDGVKEQLSREPIFTSVPRVRFKRKIKDIDDVKFEDIEIVDYQSHTPIKYPAAAV